MNHSPLSSAIKPTLAIFGKANVGKSTLFNALIQKRMSITSHRANTTRQQLQAELILDNQIAITCIDTPGIRLKKGMAYDILKLMHRAISLALESTQLILFVSDALKWTEDDEHLLQLIQKHHLLHPTKKIFWIINKIDEIPTKSQLFKHIEHIHKKYGQFDEVFMISAKKKEGLSQLHQALMNVLRPFSEGASPTLSLPEGDEEQTTLFYIKELVREQIYTFCYAEIPYIVEIDVQKHQIKTVAEALWRVTLAVDRPSQKKILIGTAGQQLKKIREATGRRLKEILGVSLKIEWFVTVKKDLNASSPSPTVLQVLRSPKPSNSKE